jgi:hypothetical protein
VTIELDRYKRGDLMRELFPGRHLKDLTHQERNFFSAEWQRRHPERRRETAKRWREKNGARYDAKRRAHRAANRAKLQAQKEKWAKENPDRVAATNALARLRRKRKCMAVQLRRNYDFTLADYDALWTAQAGRCAICGRSSGNESGYRLAVDHCHQTGIVRGLLCNRCNSALGYFGDSAKRLRKAAKYLENWRGKTNPDSGRGIQPLLGCVSETGSPFRRAQSVEKPKSVA